MASPAEDRPAVLMVTGAYFPELSGGGLQARALVRELSGRATFLVLTTSTDPSLPARASEDGVEIRRVYVDVKSRMSLALATLRLAAAFLNLAPRVEVVNLHGFSRKAIALLLLSRLLGKRFVLTLQTGVQDEPSAVRALGRAAYWAYGHADLYVSVSPGLSQAYLAAGLPAVKLRQLCNAVDVQRFRPAEAGERAALRRELRLPPHGAIVLFVGYFSRDKRPDLLYDAWSRADASRDSWLLFVGATRPSHGEVDGQLADRIRRRAAAGGLSDHLLFVESTPAIEKYFKAVDLYVLPSIREGLPIALIEAMAAGLPVVATRLPGSTDTLVEPGVSGLLVAADDRAGFTAAIDSLLADGSQAARLGAAAREVVTSRYSIQGTAPAWLAAYCDVMKTTRPTEVRA